MALLLAGCAGPAEQVLAPFDDCAALTAPPPAAPLPPVAGPAADPLPALTLSCFTGGEPVAVHAIRGPAVINLWASWCPPCREELPVLQRYAEQHAGRLHVVGVVTFDDRDKAAWFADEVGVTFPNLFDPDREVQVAVGATGLPVTLFVDAGGQLRYVHRAEALDAEGLADAVEQHLGVRPDHAPEEEA